MTQALTRFEPHEAIAVNQFPPDQFHVLIPGDMTTQMSPFLRPVARQVKLSPVPALGDVYPITQRKQGKDWVATEVGISAVGLSKLASVAGMLDVPQASGRVDDGRDPGLVTYRSTMAIRLPDGEWRVLTRECTVKLATLEKEIRTQKTKKYEDSQDSQYPWTKDRLEAEIRKELLLKEKFMERLAETGAKNRVIRSALALRQKYTPDELAKPFVLAAVVPDANQPELRERLLDQATSATAALFGPAGGQMRQEPRLLTSSAAEEDVAEAADEAEGGEITAEELGSAAPATETTAAADVEEPDWSVTSEPQEETPASPPEHPFLVVLKERAEASQAKGKPDAKTKELLKAVTRGLSGPTVMAVLGYVWKLKAPGDITAAQAEAVIDQSEGSRTFQADWRAAAEWLAQDAGDAR